MILGTGATFSFGGLAFRLTSDITSWQYVIFRGLGALVVAVALLAWRWRGQTRALVASIESTHLLAGALLGTISSIFIVALEFTTVAFILFLQALAPITSAYFSWLLLRERVSAAVTAATAASVAGVLVMVWGTFGDAVRPAALLALAIPTIFGLYATLVRRARQIDPLVPVAVAGMVLIACGVVAVGLFGSFDMSLRDAAIGTFAGSALLAVPVAIFNVAQRVVPASESSLLLMSEVVLAPLWVWIFVDETPAATTLVGGLIIFAAVLGLVLWRRSKSLGTRSRRDPDPRPVTAT